MSLKMENSEGLSFEKIIEFFEYLDFLLHSWLKTLAILGFTLVPAFFLLDIFIIPEHAKDLLPRFGLYRFVVTVILILQYFVIKKTEASRFSFLHGYFFTTVVSLPIILMTRDLGGFNSSYYAGLNLVIIAVNLLLPWKSFHSALNGFLTIIMYLLVNAIWGGDFEANILVNNLYFMASTVIIAASINHVKYILIRKEFDGRKRLKQARDALWSEMEIAKRIQTALVPDNETIQNFVICGVMIPAEEVGGDYYDIINDLKYPWVMIGDVSGHGVESGLIMMMTQTCVRTFLLNHPDASPDSVVNQLNKILIQNIALLKTDRYMTITALRLLPDKIEFAGAHQDILVYREKTSQIEEFNTFGSWVGLLDDIEPFLKVNHFQMEKGDVFLLYTDGITELGNEDGEMYEIERLKQSFLKNIKLEPRDLVQNMYEDAIQFNQNQDDDITLVVVKKVG